MDADCWVQMFTMYTASAQIAHGHELQSTAQGLVERLGQLPYAAEGLCSRGRCESWFFAVFNKEDVEQDGGGAREWVERQPAPVISANKLASQFGSGPERNVRNEMPTSSFGTSS